MKKIVILGAGFGGLRAAREISGKLRTLGLTSRYEAILIDRNEYHTYTPLLYEIATTSKETANISELHHLAAYPVQSLIEDAPITFVRGEVEALDLVHGDIHLRGGEKVTCDYLVVALGSETNYFGIAGVEENSLAMKTLADAICIRDAVWNRAMENRGDIRIAIGGGGSAGVELAGELMAWSGELKKDFPRCRIAVTIIEAAPSILPGFDPRIVRIAQKRLRKIDVVLLENEMITSAKKGAVILKGGREIPYDISIWNGGTRAPALLANLPLKTESRGRIEVAGEMICLPQTPDLKLKPMVYALGDSMCMYDSVTKKPIAGVARAAISQANIVAHNLIEEIKHAEDVNYELRIKNYAPRDYPYIIPIGGKYAVAKIGPFVISGFFGWILKILVELNYLISITHLHRAFRIWLKGIKVFIQNDRLG